MLGTLTRADFDEESIANIDEMISKPKEHGTNCRVRSIRLTNGHQHDKMLSKATAKADRNVKRC
jgi:hypothetical protein